MPDNTTLTQKLDAVAPVRASLIPKVQGGNAEGVPPGSNRAGRLAMQLQAEIEAMVAGWDRRDEAVVLDCPMPACAGTPTTTAGQIVRGTVAVCPTCGRGTRVTPAGI